MTHSSKNFQDGLSASEPSAFACFSLGQDSSKGLGEILITPPSHASSPSQLLKGVLKLGSLNYLLSPVPDAGSHSIFACYPLYLESLNQEANPNPKTPLLWETLSHRFRRYLATFRAGSRYQSELET